MPAPRRLAALAICLLLGGCGTYVPSTREWPDATTAAAERDMIEAVIGSVACELSYTVTRVIEADRFSANYRPTKTRYSDFLLDWGVEVAINITVVERSGINPTILLTPPATPSAIFTLAGGISASSEATRLQKTNIFYTIKDLYKPKFFMSVGDQAKCRNPTGNKEGSPLVDSDLHLFSLLESRMGASALRFAGLPNSPVIVKGEKNVLSQTVSFKIETSGNVTPSWRLVRATVNPSGSFLSTGRDRTHELVFTFGPLDPAAGGQRTLTPFAAQTHLNTQLQTGLATLSLFAR